MALILLGLRFLICTSFALPLDTLADGYDTVLSSSRSISRSLSSPRKDTPLRPKKPPLSLLDSLLSLQSLTRLLHSSSSLPYSILEKMTYVPFVLRFGSFDPELSAFYPTRLLGSSLSAGSPSSPVCVTGYDKASFVFGASSALFVRHRFPFS